MISILNIFQLLKQILLSYSIFLSIAVWVLCFSQNYMSYMQSNFKLVIVLCAIPRITGVGCAWWQLLDSQHTLRFLTYFSLHCLSWGIKRSCEKSGKERCWTGKSWVGLWKSQWHKRFLASIRQSSTTKFKFYHWVSQSL